MDLVTELEAFDGKHTEVLERLAALVPHRASAIRELSSIAESDEAKFQTAATWLLKRFHEDGVSFTQLQALGILNLLGRVTHWEAQLHLLQMLPGLAIPVDRTALVHRHLCGLLTSPNKFVRAWSYNGLSVLSVQHPEFQNEVAELLAKGQREEAASVRARIRNILKSKEWRKHTEPRAAADGGGM